MIGETPTTSGSYQGRVEGDEDLHDGRELYHELQAHVCVDEHVDGGGLEDAQFGCNRPWKQTEGQ